VNLYAFSWVIPRRLNFICRRFGTLCLFHLHRQVGVKYTSYLPVYEDGTDRQIGMKSYFITTCLWRWNSVPKRRNIKFGHRGITQKKAYSIQNMTKVWNQEMWICSCARDEGIWGRGVITPRFLGTRWKSMASVIPMPLAIPTDLDAGCAPKPVQSVENR